MEDRILVKTNKAGYGIQMGMGTTPEKMVKFTNVSWQEKVIFLFNCKGVN